MKLTGFTLLLGIVGGLYCIIASIKNWDFFFESRRGAIFVKILTRKGARIFYFILGLTLNILGVIAFKIIT